MLQIELV